MLDIECLDRVYLNAYVPILQSSGQVVAFMTQHLGLPIPSPALMEKIGTRFRAAVASLADANHIPQVRFGKDDRKAEVMAPYLAPQAATGRSGVAAIGISQEFQRVWAAYRRETKTAAPQFTFAKAPAGDLLLLLPVGRRIRAGVHQGLRLFPLSGQGVAQRP